jgi:hypothetical protein
MSLVTLSELYLEAFLPADDATADVLRRRHERVRQAEGSAGGTTTPRPATVP